MPHHIHQPTAKPISRSVAITKDPSISFKELLKDKMNAPGELKVSKHAEKRLQDRGIEIAPEMWKKIHTKVLEARKKGVTDSLVVTNNAALVVSAKNETVITAMDRQEAQSQLFTNINGAILMD